MVSVGIRLVRLRRLMGAATTASGAPAHDTLVLQGERIRLAVDSVLQSPAVLKRLLAGNTAPSARGSSAQMLAIIQR